MNEIQSCSSAFKPTAHAAVSYRRAHGRSAYLAWITRCEHRSTLLMVFQLTRTTVKSCNGSGTSSRLRGKHFSFMASRGQSKVCGITSCPRIEHGRSKLRSMGRCLNYEGTPPACTGYCQVEIRALRRRPHH